MRQIVASFLRRVADWLDTPEEREKWNREAMRQSMVFPVSKLNRGETVLEAPNLTPEAAMFQNITEKELEFLKGISFTLERILLSPNAERPQLLLHYLKLLPLRDMRAR